MSIEVMKQALDALETPIHEQPFGLTQAAITALRTAIEAAEKQEPVYLIWFEGSQERGWTEVEKHKYDNTKEDDRWILYTTPTAAPVQDKGQSCYCPNCEALSKQLAQRQWVGLTDDEIKEIIGPWGDTPIRGYTRKLFDQIEAKLKEKNT